MIKQQRMILMNKEKEFNYFKTITQLISTTINKLSVAPHTYILHSLTRSCLTLKSYTNDESIADRTARRSSQQIIQGKPVRPAKQSTTRRQVGFTQP